MVKETYVSLEVAKLLQEKGFDIECNNAYYNGKLIDYTMYGFCGALDFIFAPTQQMAMAWLREEKNIIINIWYDGVDWAAEYYNNEDENFYLIADSYNSYEEAVESALKYILENLI